MRGPIGNNFSRPRFPVNLHQGLYLYVLDKPRVDYTLARGPTGINWSNWLKAGADPGIVIIGSQNVASDQATKALEGQNKDKPSSANSPSFHPHCSYFNMENNHLTENCFKRKYDNSVRSASLKSEL